jgi:hypothetical protein
LGELLPEGRSPALRDSNPQHKKDPTDLGPGLRALVLKKNGYGAQPVARSGELRARSPLVTTSLVAADLLMVAVVLFWRRQAQATMSGLDAFVCITSILFSAWLSCLAAWLHFRAN